LQNVKRQRHRGYFSAAQCPDDFNNDIHAQDVTQRTERLRISDEAEVEKFYFKRFNDMQQSSCKIMGKAFVKLIEPNKQSAYPYTKGDYKAPPWWPQTTGGNYVRHKEPDHLLKPGEFDCISHANTEWYLTKDREGAALGPHLTDGYRATMLQR
jgi:hypothetical protein